MSTPQVIKCSCGKEFVFIRDTIEECPHCGEVYASHRSSKLERKQKKVKKSDKTN